ncbi:MAG: oligosaccharide flippase family protein [Deltaproteobacteria bacterium]|nr:oligosaccharide flippase family protein [Deltaproteobacteria bacterium]
MKLLRNFLSLAGAELAGKLLTFAAFAYLARIAGPEGFGIVEFAGAVLLCAGLIVDQGFGPYGAREIAREPAHTPALVAEIVGARVILALAAYAGVILFACLLDRSTILTQLLLIYGVSLLATPFLLQWVFQGHDRMNTVATVQVIRAAVFAALVFVFVRDAGQLLRVAAAEVIAVSSAAGYGTWRYWRHFGAAVRARITFSPRLFREGVPIGLSQLFWVVRMSGATLILGLVASAEDVGFFAGALRILLAAHTFVWLYFFNLLPSLARAWQQGPRPFAQLIHGSLRAVTWGSVVAGAAWVSVSPAVITTVYGARFAPAASVLQCLAGVCVIAALSGHYRFALIAAGRQGAEMLTAACGAATAVVLIPVGYTSAGVTGAALALLAAEAVVWLAAWWCSRRLLGLQGYAAMLARPVLDAAAQR